MSQEFEEIMKPHHGQIGTMKEIEALNLFEESRLAHLACHNRDDIYLVPISFIYQDGVIYSHSEPGRKIDIMRKNPHVCVQVEKIDDYSHWKSAIAWGDFEELKGDEANEAMRLLLKKVSEEVGSSQMSSLGLDMAAQLESAIIYRIKIKKMTGRFEPSH